MRALASLRLFVRSLLRRSRAEQELEAELRFHLDEEAAAHVAAGMSITDARAAARRRFGSVAAFADATRDTWHTGLLDRVD